MPLATRINAMPKLVVSTTLTSVAWQNTTVIAGDVPEELAKIKEQPGRNVTVSGGPTLVRSLLLSCPLRSSGPAMMRRRPPAPPN